MPTFTARQPVPVPAADLAAWHARPGAFERLTPPWQPVILEHFEGIGPGERAVLRLGVGAASIRWVAEHGPLENGGLGFRDHQLSGPFGRWAHEHRMLPDGPEASILEDQVDYALPLASVAEPVAGNFARSELARLFAYRHRVMREDLARHGRAHAALAAGPDSEAAEGGRPFTVAITGASGLLGSALAALLTGGGHRVIRLVRGRGEAVRLSRGPLEGAVYWNPERGELDEGSLGQAAPHAVVHLAGEPVYGLAWTAEKKRRIWESRTRGTQLLSRALARLSPRPRLLISASASGFYGSRGQEPLTEASGPGEGFLADVCQAWEASTAEAEDAGIRTLHARIGIVLSPQGGILARLGAATQAGAALWPGQGDQVWPWITLDDLAYALYHLLTSAPDLQGPVNLSAPSPEPARPFVQTLARVLRRPALGGIPAPLLCALGGQQAEELALTGARMLPERLHASGFSFAYPTLEPALRHLYGRALPSAP